MARNSHGTGTPGRMNDALGRGPLGFIARQTVQTQDFREAIYAYPDGKQGHWVHNTHSEQLYWVGDLTGGSTFKPGSIVFVASQSGKRGEKIIGRSPAGMDSASVATVQVPNAVGPPAAPPPPSGTQGLYLGWSYFCEGGGYVWTACIHHRFRYETGPVFVDGTREIRIGKLSMANLVGGADMPVDGYEVGQFDNGVGGAEVCRSPEEEMTSLTDFHFTVSLVQAGGTIFVVTVAPDGTSYTIHLLDDSGNELASDTFSGRTWANSPDALDQHSAIYSNVDGNFYFAHPIGSGSEEFRICRRSGSTAEIASSVDIDFNADGHEFSGIAPIPSGSGVRVFGSKGTGNPCEYKDFDPSMSALTGWVAMDFGPDNEVQGGKNVFVRTAGGYAALGNNATDVAVFLIEENGDFNVDVGENADARSPIYPAASGSFVFIVPGVTGEFALGRMLSDGTMA